MTSRIPASPSWNVRSRVRADSSARGRIFVFCRSATSRARPHDAVASANAAAEATALRVRAARLGGGRRLGPLHATRLPVPERQLDREPTADRLAVELARVEPSDRERRDPRAPRHRSLARSPPRLARGLPGPGGASPGRSRAPQTSVAGAAWSSTRRTGVAEPGPELRERAVEVPASRRDLVPDALQLELHPRDLDRAALTRLHPAPHEPRQGLDLLLGRLERLDLGLRVAGAGEQPPQLRCDLGPQPLGFRRHLVDGRARGVDLGPSPREPVERDRDREAPFVPAGGTLAGGAPARGRLDLRVRRCSRDADAALGRADAGARRRHARVPLDRRGDVHPPERGGLGCDFLGERGASRTRARARTPIDEVLTRPVLLT